ncbi:MAG: ribosome assembly RNA-binding protein YhbY [Chitinispirillaceae bacterium]
MEKLTSRQRQYLKGLGHGLKPYVQVGKEGIADNVLESISKALDDHELVKVGLLDSAGLDRKSAAQEMADALNAELVQVVGLKILLFRRNPEDPRVKLPEA